MTVGIYSLAEKQAAMDVEIKEARAGRRSPGSALHHQYEVLKSIAADLRARQELPRNNTLGQLERQIELVRKSGTALGYDRMRLMELANFLINRWPIVSQALEQFGEEAME